MYCTYSSPSFRIRKDCKLRFLVRKRNYGTKEFLIEWIFYRLIYIFVPLLSNQERFLERKNYETEGIFSKVDLLQIDVHIRPPPFELEKIVNSDFWRGRGTMERKEFLVKWIFYRLYIFVPLSNQNYTRKDCKLRFLERKNYGTERIFSKVDLLQIDVHIRPSPFELGKIVNSDFWRGRGTMERKEFLVKQIFYRLMSSPSFRIRIRLGKIVNFDFWRGRRTLERKEFLIFHNTYEYPDYYTYNVYIFQHI